MKRPANWGKQSGFTALEMMVVLIVTVAALGLGSQYLMSYADGQVNQAAADHSKTVADAATKYIKDNYAAILATATPSTPATITVPMLKSTGYLTSSVTDQNPYGQTYQILALEPVASKLETLIVTSGGETIPEMDLRRIAQASGARGGFISSTNTAIATGSYGGWQMPLANYGVAPGAGHLATSLFFDDGALVSDYLYRNAVAGHPEFNRMNTAIDMGGNNINNGGTVNAQRAVLPGGDNAHSLQVGNAYFYGDAANTAARSQPGGGFYVQDVNGNAADIKSAKDIYASTTQTSESYANGWFRTRGDSGWYSEKWGGGWYMSDPTWIRAYNSKNVWTPGTLQADTNVNSAYVSAWGWMNSAGRLRTGEYLQIDGWANEGWGCGPNALQGRDGTGLLTCQSGVWTRPGGKIAPFRVDGAGTCSWAAATAVCPGGSRLIAGGYVLTWFNGSNFSHAPDGSYPDASGNQWVINGSGTDSCFQAFATCTY